MCQHENTNQTESIKSEYSCDHWYTSWKHLWWENQSNLWLLGRQTACWLKCYLCRTKHLFLFLKRWIESEMFALNYQMSWKKSMLMSYFSIRHVLHTLQRHGKWGKGYGYYTGFPAVPNGECWRKRRNNAWKTSSVGLLNPRRAFKCCEKQWQQRGKSLTLQTFPWMCRRPEMHKLMYTNKLNDVVGNIFWISQVRLGVIK